LYIDIRRETIPPHAFIKFRLGCIRLPAESMNWTPCPVDTILKEYLKQWDVFLKGGYGMYVT
jgi:hypothetical protein